METQIKFPRSNAQGFRIDVGSAQLNFENPFCILDRDGIILKEKIREDNTFGSIRKIEEFEYEKNSVLAIKNLLKHDINVIVVSNQPDVENKKISNKTLQKINKKIIEDTGISAVIYCTHDKKSNCLCRKPKIKMLEWLLPFTSQKIIVIGDRLSDYQFAKNLNLNFLHVNSKKCSLECKDIEHFNSLFESECYLLKYLRNLV